MATLCNVRYGAFWDQPRVFYTLSEKHSYLFECLFDEELDDYPEKYDVYSMPHLRPSDFSNPWIEPQRSAVRLLGAVKITQSSFDRTLRQQIDLDVIEHLVAPKASPAGA